MRRFTLFDTLNLRKTSVYRNPRNISTLKIVFGDFSFSKIPCIPIDKAGLIYHISDKPMQQISKVFIDGEPKTHGYRAYTAYQDETGKSIAAIVFDNPQFDSRVSVSGKGSIKETGELIENPADIILDVFLNIQGYDEASLDLQDIYNFYSDCLTEDLKIACLLQEEQTIREFLDALAMNIHAQWLISNGKSVMRLRWK